MARPLQITVDVNVNGLPALKDVSASVDATGASLSKMDQIGTGALERVGHKFTDFATGIISSGVSAVIDNIGNSIELASNKTEAAGKAQILFGQSYDQVSAASQTATRDVGLSSGAYLALAGDLGNLTRNLGFTEEASAGMSVNMLQLAADMGSFNNASTEDVTFAMGAAFRGEMEPIRQFGVFLDDARVKAKAMELGLYDGVGALDANAKAQATYALILEQTALQQGNFALTANDAANAAKINAAKQEEAWTQFGAAIVPIKMIVDDFITTGIQLLTGALSLLADNIPTVTAVLAPLGLVIAAAVVPPFLAWAAATLAATWPLLAIGAAVGAVVFALDKLGILKVIIDLFSQVANAIMSFLKPAFDVIGNVVSAVAGFFGNFGQVLQGPVDAAIGVVTGGLNFLKPIFDTIGGVVDLVGDAFAFFADILRGPVEFAISLVKKVLDGLQPVFEVIRGVVGDLMKGFQIAFDTIGKVVTLAGEIIGKVIDGIAGFFDGLITTAQDLMRDIQNVFNAIWRAIEKVGNDVMKFLGDIFDPFVDAINWAIGIFKDVWNGFARLWNSIQLDIPRIEIPNPFGGFIVLGGNSIGLPDLPLMAKGGLVTSPLIAALGESGPEAVIPLDRMPLGGNTYNVQVYAGVGDPVEIGREVVEKIRAFERANGPSGIG